MVFVHLWLTVYSLTVCVYIYIYIYRLTVYRVLLCEWLVLPGIEQLEKISNRKLENSEEFGTIFVKRENTYVFSNFSYSWSEHFENHYYSYNFHVFSDFSHLFHTFLSKTSLARPKTQQDVICYMIYLININQGCIINSEYLKEVGITESST